MKFTVMMKDPDTLEDSIRFDVKRAVAAEFPTLSKSEQEALVDSRVEEAVESCAPVVRVRRVPHRRDRHRGRDLRREGDRTMSTETTETKPYFRVKCSRRGQQMPKWCTAMHKQLHDEPNARKAGLATCVVAERIDARGIKQRLIGVAMKKSASDKGILLNVCPWCGEGVAWVDDKRGEKWRRA